MELPVYTPVCNESFEVVHERVVAFKCSETMLVGSVVHYWEVHAPLSEGYRLVNSESNRSVRLEVNARNLRYVPLRSDFDVVPEVMRNFTAVRLPVATEFLVLELEIFSTDAPMVTVLYLTVAGVACRVDCS